uniref:WW domain-containing protein n=1 Tax=Leptocylindrus danicus TaxID=163516 RepID=A0A7S2NT19_9STRA|mmetsp:Transcript_12517/g.18812  ORF Transcript_12517/g.18812 Transcript_12517/m.18812 type:complete len:798 (+) Transcript_12517:267-2660(+)
MKLSKSSNKATYYIDLSYGCSQRPLDNSRQANLQVLPATFSASDDILFCPPSLLSECDIARREKEALDLVDIQNRLNITDKELSEFELELEYGVTNRKSSFRADYNLTENAENRLPIKSSNQGKKIELPSRRSTEKNVALGDKRKKKSVKSPKKDPTLKHGTRKRVSEMLRSELAKSMSNVRALSDAVKKDVASIQWMCRGLVKNEERYPGAQHRLKSWGTHQIVLATKYLILVAEANAYSRWKALMMVAREKEKRMKYLQYQGLRKLGHATHHVGIRYISGRWLRWGKVVLHYRKVERQRLEYKSAVIIQNLCRSVSAKIVAFYMKQLREIRSATFLQAFVRRICALRVYRTLQHERKLRNASVVIQCAYRCYHALHSLYQLRVSRVRRNSSIDVQRLFRGMRGRKVARTFADKRRIFNAACNIQSLWRGIHGREKANARKLFVKRNNASIVIQAFVRGSLSTKKVKMLRLEAERLIVLQKRMSVKLQRAYRSHRKIVLTKLEMVTQVALARRKFRAAARIQSLFRGVQARVLFSAMMEEHFNIMVTNARRWQETWGEDVNCWYYYDTETEQTLWEPPASGYTKSDTRLVLQDGSVVDDPWSEQAEIVHAKCDDCDEAIATRQCDQCGDKYCSACYTRAHPKGGRRELHTYVHIGPIECEECSQKQAKKWCTMCDGPFCLSCFEKMHSRGYRSLHAYCNIYKSGNISPRAWGPDGSAAGMFVPGSTYDAGNNTMDGGEWYDGDEEEFTEHEYDKFYEDGDPSGIYDGVWSTHYDEEGNAYYYNSETGESLYDYPDT